MTPLLQIDGLHTQFRTESGTVRAVDGISFTVHAGETLALVGESGCGKSAAAFSILGLIQGPQGRIAGGSIRFEGVELVGLEAEALRRLRGSRISMIFQDPMTSLNPVLTIGEQIVEIIRAHESIGTRDARTRAVAMLELVRIPDPARTARSFPHQLSGGMRQRVMIAIALSCRPRMLIADEPTTALDVTVQHQILELIDTLKRQFDMAVLLITHDLGVVAQYADRVAVMYAGRIAEVGSVEQVFERPAHPYTERLLASIPKPGQDHGDTWSRRLVELPGAVPNPYQWGEGCRFFPRCHAAMPICERQTPDVLMTPQGGEVACFAFEAEASGNLANEPRGSGKP